MRIPLVNLIDNSAMNDDSRHIFNDSLESQSTDNRLDEVNLSRPRLSSASSGLDMQFATVLDRVTMPTPEAAKMARYADFPVSPSLGTADITIPIYEINTGRLRLPISLQYSTFGIKVNEISGPVGLGWHLNAGGVITRTICGVQDGQAGYLPMRGRITENSISNPHHDGDISEGTDDMLSAYASGEGDSQYDRFSYSFLGHTGSFIVVDNRIVTLTPTDLKMEMPAANGVMFRITDTHGTVYDFGVVETSSKSVSSPSPTPLAPSNTCGMGFPTNTPTSWHLTCITSMDGMDRIEFEYESDSEALQNEFITTRDSYHKTYRLSYKYFNSNNGTSWHWRAVSDYGQIQYSPGLTPDIVSSDWRYEISEGFRPRMLKRITFRGGSVDFSFAQSLIPVSTNIRRSYKKHLSCISVFNTENAPTMSAEFSYRMTGLSDRRELLETITFKGTSGTVYDGRTMEYYDPDTVMLPQAQDLFGYYNGAAGNTTLVPFKLFSDNYTISEVYGNRSYNANSAKALSLKSIETRSGAYTEIRYEGNSVQAPSTSVLATIGVGIRVARIITGNKVKPEGRDSWTKDEEALHVARIRSFSYSDPVLTIPAADFTHNRFITASECCTALESTNDHTWEGLYGPERTCTVTIGDQSVHGGAPLESAAIVYSKVSETISDPSGHSWSRTEYTFNAEACVKERLWDVTSLPEDHDIFFAQTYRIESDPLLRWGFHLFQRIPNAITRNGMSPSVTLTPPAYLFTEANCPMMTMPTQVRKFSRSESDVTERIIEKVTYTYETGTAEVLTGFTVKNLVSLMLDNYYGMQNPGIMCLHDYKQTEFKTRVILSRLLSCETTTYNDGTRSSSPEGSEAKVTLERRFYGNVQWRRTSENQALGTPHIDGYDDVRYPAMPIDTSSLATPGIVLGPSVVMTSVDGNPSASRTMCLLRVCDFDSSVSAQTHQHTQSIPYLDELYSLHYMEPIGVEIIYGELVKPVLPDSIPEEIRRRISVYLMRPAGLEHDSRFIYFSDISPDNSIKRLVPVRQDTFRNGTFVRTDWEITEYDSHCNPVEICEPGMPTRVIVRGYKGLYPIAEIIGMQMTRHNASEPTDRIVDEHTFQIGSATYSLRSLISSALTQSTPSDVLWTGLASLRDSTGGALVTIQKHAPLVGPVEVTDHMGAASIYAYDNAGRLSSQGRRGTGEAETDELLASWDYDFLRSDGATNSIRQRTYTDSGANESSARMAVTRFDGMGRTLQTSLVGASPSGGDIVQPFAPDFLDREDAITYLPYREASSNGGAYRDNALPQQSSFYIGIYGNNEGQYAFSRKNYEASTRNRVSSASLPGHGQDTKTVITVEGITSAEVMKIRTDADITAGTPAANMIRDGHWPAGSLVKTTTTGPDGSVTQVFSNEFGSTVLERRLISGSANPDTEEVLIWSSTYYVRDTRDRVLCVVPPDEYDALTAGSASSLPTSGCYVYMYDNQDRVIYRKLPNCTATSVEYDDAGRITKESTGSRIFTNGYDALGRLVSRKYRYGTGALRTLMEYSYDSYPSTLASDGLSFSAVPDVVNESSSSVKGLKTSERVRVLQSSEMDSAFSEDSSATFVTRAFYYDNIGRLVQTVEKNHLGQVSRISVEYDFTGNVIATRETQTAGTGTSSVAAADTSMIYDGHGRITSFRVSMDGINAGSTYSYDAIGRPKSRILGRIVLPSIRTATAARELPLPVRLGVAVTDSYTIQGWLSQRSSIPFTSQLKYCDPAHGTAPAPGLAGNITEWKTHRNGTTSNGSTYAFTYDLMSRLVSSSRYAGDSTVAENPYTEKDITYFADSRIKAMRRYGASPSSVQNLSFVTDSNTYDDYRNVTNDATSGTVMDWNILNLPRKMTTSDGIVSEYTYLADGTKVSMKSGTTTLHYLGSMVFSQAGSAAPVFESMAFSEGRIVVNSSGAKEVHYHITDHLGSVRSVVKADGTVIAENDFYPYGKRINAASATAPTQNDRHTFSGKEDQALTPGQAPYLDFGARMYSPETGRWLSVDPMAEKYYSISSYAYCGGNPIIMIDKSGKDIWKVNELGYLTVSQDKTKDQFMASNGKSLSLPYGTIEHSGKYDYNGKQSYDFLRVRGDDNGTQLFEFLAQNTNVEWSHAMMGKEGDDGLNFITSSHSREAEDGMTYLVKWQLQHGYTGRRFDHSHPNNDASPSGIGDNYTGDINFADYVRRHVNGDNIIFHIYTPGDSTYHEYDEYTDINTISESCITGEKLKINGLNWPWD